MCGHGHINNWPTKTMVFVLAFITQQQYTRSRHLSYSKDGSTINNNNLNFNFCAKRSVFLCAVTYVTKYHSFGVFPIKKSLEKYSWFFPIALRHYECGIRLLVHPRLNATPVSLLAPVRLPPRGPESAHTCSLIGRWRPLGVMGAWGCTMHIHVHAHWLVDVLLCLPQCWLDEWVTINYSVLLASAVQQVTGLSMHRVCVLWNHGY